MPRLKIDVRNKLGEAIAIEIQAEVNGPVYTYASGQIANISNPVEFARVSNIPGVTPLDGAQRVAPPPIPLRSRE